MTYLKAGLAGFVAIAVIAGAAQAQQPKPKPAAPPPPAQAEGPPPGADVLFPCRSAKEICYVGAVTNGKLAVLFTNDAKAEEIGGKPLAVSAGDGSSPLDLSANEGKVVMIVGSYESKTGLTTAEVVDVAGPLLGFALKANAGGGDDGPPAPPPPPAGKKR